MADGVWLANFASESVKSSGANITITTTARRTGGGWILDGEKSFGCATGVADYYLTTARLDGYGTAEGLATFFVPRDAAGVSVRDAWDGLGMRATANNGIRLAGVFVPDDEALTVPGAFTRMLRMSRGSFVGNQLAIAAVYTGCAQNVYDHTIEATTRKTFADTGRPIASSPVHQQLIGEMTRQLETAYLWLRYQLDLESSQPPRRPKQEVFKQWRLGKGSVTEACFQVALGAFTAGGTSGAMMGGVAGRALRDLAMGLVMTFPAERGRLEVAQIVTSAKENELFTTAPASASATASAPSPARVPVPPGGFVIDPPEPRDLVAGAWGPAREDLGFDLEDPATGEPVGRARASRPERIERALGVAEAAARAAPSGSPPSGPGPSTRSPTPSTGGSRRSRRWSPSRRACRSGRPRRSE
nr:hypothetical protein GCM10020093_008890 [Planobispora longispora]